MLTRRTFLTTGVAAAATLAAAPSSFAAGAGQITKLSGKAIALVGTTERALAVGAPVAVNDLIQTAANSRLAMKLGDDTFINLGPSTKLRIEPHLVDVGGQFDLIDGSVLMEHTRPAGRQPHKAELKSPYGLIAVRGTKFFAGPSQGKFAVFVEEGRVDLITKQTTVALTPGFGSDVARRGDAATTAVRWAAARSRAAYLLTTGLPPAAKTR